MNDGTPLDEAALRAHPLAPVESGDKDSKGQILVVAGSRSVPGAALLTATAAMRAGAGKLQIATVESAAMALAIAMPEALVMGLPEDDRGSFAPEAVGEIAKAAAGVDGVVAGPGTFAADTGRRLSAALLGTRVPLALDAGLLHTLEAGEARAEPTNTVLLPHAGELASLLDCDEAEIEREPIACGIRAARRYSATLVVKGVVSNVVTPDGKAWTYRGGCPGLGVSGSGDVLAGVVGGLLARGAEPLNALLWAVWLHGEAGARLAKRVGPLGFLARELAGEVPALLPR